MEQGNIQPYRNCSGGYLTKRVVIIFCLLLCTLYGCKNQGKIPPQKAPPVLVITVGLPPDQNIFHQVERYQPLADYLSAKTGATVRLKVIPSYGNVVDNIVSTGVDAAFLGSFAYILAHTELGVEVLARPESLDGISTYHGLIFVRKDSGIKTIKDMKGKSFAFVDKETTAGYLLPVAYFKTRGIKNYRTYLKEVYFTGTHEDGIYYVLNKKADIGAAKNTVFERLAVSDSRINNELMILESSPDVPENGLAVRRDLNSALKEKLKQSMLNMAQDAEGQKVLKQFGARKFIETRDEDYEPVYKYARKINLDLRAFDSVNE
jgi:phosphonate transport system substrate-binding protein